MLGVQSVLQARLGVYRKAGQSIGEIWASEGEKVDVDVCVCLCACLLVLV